MLDTLTRENIRDFEARYSNTFGWLHQDGSKKLCQLCHVEDEVIYFKFGGRATFHARVDSGVMFEFIPVDRGWFNTVDHGPVFLERIPARQWKRGICSSNTRAQNVYMEDLNVNYKLLSSVFEGDGVDIAALLKAGSSVALSKHFCVSAGGLKFYNRAVGSVFGDKIVLNNTIIKQELCDLLKRKNIRMEVSVNE